MTKFKLIYSKNKELWDYLIKTTEEIDDFMSVKDKNEFGLNLNKNFFDALKGFKPLKSMRTRRSRLSKIKKSKAIVKKTRMNINIDNQDIRIRGGNIDIEENIN